VAVLSADEGRWCASEVRWRVLDDERLPEVVVVVALLEFEGLMVAEDIEPVVRERSCCEPDVLRPSRGKRFVGVLMSSESSSSMSSTGVARPLTGSAEVYIEKL
jgi:hypothetical protein